MNAIFACCCHLSSRGTYCTRRPGHGGRLHEDAAGVMWPSAVKRRVRETRDEARRP